MSIQYFAGVEKQPGLDCAADILVCLGDYWPVGRPDKFLEKLLPLCEAGWSHVVYVMGLLEADHLEYEVAVDFLSSLDDKIENFHFLYNRHIDFEEYKIRIFGSPLFTDMAYDVDPDSEAGSATLSAFLPTQVMTATTNAAFGLDTVVPAEEVDDMPEGSMYSKATDGTLRRCTPLSKYWWVINHKTARESLAGALVDASNLPQDWVMVVATHFQPAYMLDRECDATPMSDCSLRYSCELPIAQYARMLDRTLVWLYGQATHYGRATTGNTKVDSAVLFYGTPSAYVPGMERFVLDISVMPATLDEQLRNANVHPDSVQVAGGTGAAANGGAANGGAASVAEMTEEVFEERMRDVAASASATVT